MYVCTAEGADAGVAVPRSNALDRPSLDGGPDPRAVCCRRRAALADHRELVLAAIAAGKHVYCEWPLGTNVVEAEEMANAAHASKIYTAIGLQMRSSATVLQARKALQAGRIGRPLTARIVSNTAAFGSNVETAMAFAEDQSKGVTLVSIQGAHTFDLAIAVLGGFAAFSALTTTQFPEVRVGDKTTFQHRTTSDHVFLQGQLASGVAIGIEVAGGRAAEASTQFEVIGTEGTLRIQGGAMRGVQAGRLHLLIDGKSQTIDEGAIASLPDAAAHVAGVYTMLRDDILNDTRNAPDFEHAVRLTRFVEAVYSSGQNSERQKDTGWPAN